MTAPLRLGLMVSTLAIFAGCDDAPSAPAPQEDAAPSPTPRFDDDARMTLRLPRPGAPRADVVDRIPECAAQLEPDGARCRFHEWIRPLPAPCEDGCTWWTYRFDADRLDVAELDRSVWDVDATYAEQFAAEAHRVASELDRRLGVAPEVDVLADWAAVEASADGTHVLLERRTWTVDDALVTWTLTGSAGHHPGVTLRVRMEAPHPEDLRVEMLDPGLTTGAPLLRLRGGIVPRPLDVPLWLTFGADDDIDRCSLHHEALAFPLPDGRLYVGQYNPMCGDRACRVIDPRTGEGAEPTGGCLWGDGIHHRAEAIGDGHVLLTSDGEGVGAIQIVRYDGRSESDVVLELSLSPHGPLSAVVRDGGVDFETVCDLPPGCEFREYGEVPARRYRWTARGGLVEQPEAPP